MKISGLKDTIDWYNKNSEKYASVAGESSQNQINSIDIFLSKLRNNPFVLDAGCGDGISTRVFYEKGVKIIGIDLSEGLLQVARGKTPDIRYVEGTFLELPFEDGTFDGIWSRASLVHLETIEDVHGREEVKWIQYIVQRSN